MKQFKIGMLVRSKSGHDHGTLYVIKDMQGEYLYLVDGRIRTLDRPKKKKAMHVQMTHDVSTVVTSKITENVLTNEDIKREIKLRDKTQSIN